MHACLEVKFLKIENFKIKIFIFYGNSDFCLDILLQACVKLKNYIFCYETYKICETFKDAKKSWEIELENITAHLQLKFYIYRLHLGSGGGLGRRGEDG